MPYFAMAVIAYLLGALPFAIWISKSFYGRDVRSAGSGNAGSTNMYRVFGLWAGLITQLLDISKGALAAALPLLLAAFVPILSNQFVQQNATAFMLGCGLFAVLGHVYSVFAGFKGGKGVNTMLGMMLIVHPDGSLVAVVLFLIMLLLTRMVSVGSMSAVLGFNVYLLLTPLLWGQAIPWVVFTVSLLLLFAVIYTHRSNIARIRAGTENRVNLFGKKA